MAHGVVVTHTRVANGSPYIATIRTLQHGRLMTTLTFLDHPLSLEDCRRPILFRIKCSTPSVCLPVSQSVRTSRASSAGHK